MPDKSRKLFRAEAVVFHHGRWAGQALLIARVPSWITLIISLFFLLILILALRYAHMDRRTNVTGEATFNPRFINILSTQPGYVAERYVEPGQKVKKGQLIYLIDVNKVTNHGVVSTQSRMLLEDQRKNLDQIIMKTERNKDQELEHIRSQLEQKKIKLKQTKDSLSNATKGLTAAKKSFESYNAYRKKGWITQDQLNYQASLYYQQQNIYDSLLNQKEQETLLIKSLENDLKSKAIEFENKISEYENSKSNVSRSLNEVETNGFIAITAPVDGFIETMSVSVGQMLAAHDAMAQIIPEAEKKALVVLWVPGSGLPYINVNDKVNLRYSAYPYERFGQFSGKIVSVSAVPASLQEMGNYRSAEHLLKASNGENYYKVFVEPASSVITYESKSIALTEGLLAEATLFLENRPLYQWVFQPYYKIKKALQGR
ncbi:HlyD family secretion protein [Pantoea sp.]|uniref:HlyD family secretion protein n=1 Tax=Pantoea sp. TaxID=69393 RepID=UPI00289F5517|nr:HlyD family secretion protein [Pantoea sp.]